MTSGRVGLKRYIIPITFDIFKPMLSMCLLHLRSEDIISTRKLNSDTVSMLIVLILSQDTQFFSVWYENMQILSYCHSMIIYWNTTNQISYQAQN